MEGHSGSAHVSFELMAGGLTPAIEMSKMVPGFGFKRPEDSCYST